MSSSESPTDENSSSEEKVTEDIAQAFETVSDETSEPEVLKLDEADSETLRREKDGKPVAGAYFCPTYDCKAYYSVRDENHHYFFKKKGYPIDDSILQELKDKGVEKVFIGLERGKSVLEFDLSQYLDCETFDEGHGVQRCEAKDEAVRVWPNAVGSVLNS